MTRTAIIPCGETEGIRAVELVFQGGTFSFTALMPVDPDRFDERERRLDGRLLHRVLSGLASRRAEVHLPRLRFDLDLDLTETLRTMGMKRAFPGIDPQTGLSIDWVIRRAFLQPYERGTEAAAGTAVGMKKESASAVFLFRADRPFLILIREREIGAILFLGRAADPSSEGGL